MPAKGKSKLTKRQRTAIAKGKIAGKTNKQLAAELDLHPQTVQRHVSDPRTTTLIARLKEPHEESFARIMANMVKWLEVDTNSKNFTRRYLAQQRATKLMTAGEPPIQKLPPAAAGDFTLEELLITIRRVDVKAPHNDAA